jgi:2-phosphosulfolactate phosphatase
MTINTMQKARSLVVDVLLTPAELGNRLAAGPTTVAIVIDVIRATTTLSVMFDRGCARVLVAGDIPEARAFATQHAGVYLLAGETGGLRPPGFDFGNSPVELATANLAGREVVFSTTNGTRAIRACAGARAILAGSLRNAEVVCRAALGRVVAPPEPATAQTHLLAETASEARSKPEELAPDLVIVCSGRLGRPAVDDTLCAGVLLASLERLAPAYDYALELREGARLSQAVYAGASSLYGMLWASAAGQAVVRVGLKDDLALCADVDASRSVPLVVGADPAGLLIVERAAE